RVLEAWMSRRVTSRSSGMLYRCGPFSEEKEPIAWRSSEAVNVTACNTPSRRSLAGRPTFSTHSTWSLRPAFAARPSSSLSTPPSVFPKGSSEGTPLCWLIASRIPDCRRAAAQTTRPSSTKRAGSLGIEPTELSDVSGEVHIPGLSQIRGAEAILPPYRHAADQPRASGILAYLSWARYQRPPVTVKCLHREATRHRRRSRS